MTADEVLKQMQIAAVSQTDNSVCVIDPETRTITVPPEYQLLGVENDKRVERITFRCPKIVGDNQDLSQNYQLFINYQNANGDLDAYHIDDMSVEEDNITFTWLLEENVTKYKGNIKFAFGAIKPGDEAEDPDKNRWNTTINTDCTCLVGLKCTQQVAESNPDALVQIWAAIDELKAGGGGSGTPGKDGVGIDRIEKTSTQGLVDTYTIYLTDESTYTFTVTNGANGKNGITPTIGENGNWYLGDEDTGKPSRGEKGDPGEGSEAEPYELPIMSDTQLGGGKAVSKTDEDVPVAVDTKTGQLFVPTYPVQGGITEEQKQQLEQNTQDITDLKNTKVDVEKEINPEWEKWSDVRYNYGFDKNIQPIFNTIKGILETDTMISVRGGKGRWNKTDKPASEFVSGGHVFEGWSGKELARLTMLIGKFHEMFACIQTYSPAGLYQSTRRFGWVKLGSDEKNKGFDFSQGWSTCYTPLTFQPLSRPTTVMDYDLNPQFTSSTVPIGTLYYDQGENRFNVFTSNGWKSIAFTDDINNSENKEPTEPFSGNIEYTVWYPRKEDGIITNNGAGSYSAWFPVETSKSYKVTRSELTDRFRIYLYNSEDLDSAFSSKEPGFLVVEDANNNVLDSLVFTNNNTYKFALVLLDNTGYYSPSVTISVLTSKN